MSSERLTRTSECGKGTSGRSTLDFLLSHNLEIKMAKEFSITGLFIRVGGTNL